MERRNFILATGGVIAASLAGKERAVAAPVAVASAVLPQDSNYADASVEPWMQGSPPPADRIIRFEDGSFFRWPQVRWTFCHIEELVPTRTIWRGNGAVSELGYARRKLGGIPVKSLDGRTLTLDQALGELYTSGFLVMHRGRIVLEHYAGHLQPYTRHFIASVTKSYTGTVAQSLVHEGLLDREQGVSHYLPELADSAWGDARVADVMDMLVGMKYDEDYSRPDSEVYRYLGSMGLMPRGPDSDIPLSAYQYAQDIPKQGEHNRAFAYREPNITVLGWLVRRVTGRALSDLYSERFWQPMGMERDAYLMLDGWGMDASICCTLRDFARFGEMIRNRGAFNGRQVVHPAVVDSFFRGGDVNKFAAGDTEPLQTHSYTSQWWIRHLDGRNAVQGRGAYGQSLYIDPAAEVVIAKFGAARTASSKTLEHLASPIHDAIVAAI